MARTRHRFGELDEDKDEELEFRDGGAGGRRNHVLSWGECSIFRARFMISHCGTDDEGRP